MRKIYLSCALILALANLIPSTTTISYFEIGPIGPYESFEQDTDISFSYKLNKSMSNVIETLKVRNAKTNQTYYTISKASHKLTKNVLHEVTFPLKTHLYLGNDGLNIQIDIKSNDETLLFKNAIIYPKENKTIYVSKDNVARLQSKNVGFEMTAKDTNYVYDDFNFYDLENYQFFDLFYGFGLSPFSFLYNSENLNYKSAQLSFSDKSNVYKNMSHQNGRINLQLDIINQGKAKIFKYHNQLYVNRVNLDISDYYIPGYEETEELFFPVNSKENFAGTEFEIVINECGYNKYNLVFNLTYDDQHYLIGNCFQSDYCIIGEVK